ncbi:MAG: aminopeptidase P family N-terminal domain-containing protein, partial [Oscillospiraceae bacterium]
MKKQIEQLQARMRRDKIDIYLIPTSDYHQSEYVRDFFKAKDFLSGFTGSAGTLVVTVDTAGIWTDGRYFIQASHQLKQSG